VCGVGWLGEAIKSIKLSADLAQLLRLPQPAEAGPTPAGHGSLGPRGADLLAFAQPASPPLKCLGCCQRCFSLPDRWNSFSFPFWSAARLYRSLLKFCAMLLMINIGKTILYFVSCHASFSLPTSLFLFISLEWLVCFQARFDWATQRVRRLPDHCGLLVDLSVQGE